MLTVCQMERRPFLREAAATPTGVHRSPNRLHEFVLLDILRHTDRRYVAFVDPDVLFVGNGAIDRVFDYLEQDPARWAAGFIDRERPQPWGSDWITTRDRLHSIAAFFNASVMQQRFPFQRYFDAQSFEEQLDLLCTYEAAEHYRKVRMLDTLSLVTEYLRTRCDVDRVLDLSTRVERCAEGQMLTVVSDLLVHAKYLEAGGAGALAETLERAGLGGLVIPELSCLLQSQNTQRG